MADQALTAAENVHGGGGAPNSKTKLNLIFLTLNAVVLSVGNCGGPLISRLYFLHGGQRIWFSSWLLTGGWPANLIPILILYYLRRRRTAAAPLVLMKPRVFFAAAVIGILTGADDYLYAYGIAKLPVSTSSLIIASQLVFTAAFAYLLVKQRFTSYTANAVFLLTLASVVLGLHTSGDRPAGESGKEYAVGFGMTVAAAALYGLVLPLVELTYRKAEQELSYDLIMEIQLVMCFFATVVCTVGMVVNKDFQAIAREARSFDLGETTYYVVVICSAIIWQCFFLGAIGVIYYSSSLVSGILIAALIPVTELLAVIFYKEKFKSEKGLSLVLSLWGFLSYFYGEFRLNKKKLKKKKKKNSMMNSKASDNTAQETELALRVDDS